MSDDFIVQGRRITEAEARARVVPLGSIPIPGDVVRDDHGRPIVCGGEVDVEVKRRGKCPGVGYSPDYARAFCHKCGKLFCSCEREEAEGPEPRSGASREE